jgi:hypothetical protein
MWLNHAEYIRLTERLMWAERRVDELQRQVDSKLVARLEADIDAQRLRAIEAEARLEKERTARDRVSLAFADHMATRDKGYAISTRVKDLETPALPLKVNDERRLSAEDDATLTYYRQCAKEAGLGESVADEWFAAYLRGEEPTLSSSREQ